MPWGAWSGYGAGTPPSPYLGHIIGQDWTSDVAIPDIVIYPALGVRGFVQVYLHSMMVIIIIIFLLMVEDCKQDEDCCRHAV
ncbi:hypothetical protein VTO42DRAFT_1954 [Malbranchea cinnamomea]